MPRLAVVGFSLGGNLALLMLGRRRERLPRTLVATAAISAPVDLATCAAALESPGNGVYQHYFMRMLAEAYRRRHAARPDLFSAGRELGLRTVREYDDRITAPFGGYESAAQYYERSSAGPWLAAIDRPALLLAAADDPMIPTASVARWPLLGERDARDRERPAATSASSRARRRPAGSGRRSGRSRSWKATPGMPRRS